ncbi:skin secretory protein xP2-like [Melospiza georgiana]|uniref:skin secretory protein xP2-like n=1 Tax=Melospiza georgiana TaxID=44398 RepID=UPI0025ABF58C|nr:skin secretory protein xP2-like [Melospiza georgiana]
MVRAHSMFFSFNFAICNLEVEKVTSLLNKLKIESRHPSVGQALGDSPQRCRVRDVRVPLPRPCRVTQRGSWCWHPELSGTPCPGPLSRGCRLPQPASGPPRCPGSGSAAAAPPAGQPGNARAAARPNRPVAAAAAAAMRAADGHAPAAAAAAAGEPGSDVRGEQPREHGRPRSPASPAPARAQPALSPREPSRSPLMSPSLMSPSTAAGAGSGAVGRPHPSPAPWRLPAARTSSQMPLHLRPCPGMSVMGKARWPAPQWPWAGLGYQQPHLGGHTRVLSLPSSCPGE